MPRPALLRPNNHTNLLVRRQRCAASGHHLLHSRHRAHKLLRRQGCAGRRSDQNKIPTSADLPVTVEREYRRREPAACYRSRRLAAPGPTTLRGASKEVARDSEVWPHRADTACARSPSCPKLSPTKPCRDGCGDREWVGCRRDGTAPTARQPRLINNKRTGTTRTSGTLDAQAYSIFVAPQRAHGRPKLLHSFSKLRLLACKGGRGGRR